jgi:hypothetical protein
MTEDGNCEVKKGEGSMMGVRLKNVGKHERSNPARLGLVTVPEVPESA